MEFICLDFAEDFNLLYEGNSAEQDTINSSGIIKQKSFLITGNSGNKQYLYSEKLTQLFSARVKESISFRNLDSVVSDFDIEYSGNTGFEGSSDTNLFLWRISRITDFQNSIFLSIVTSEGKLYFAKPQRTGTSKEISYSAILSQFKNFRAAGVNFSGESSGEYFINLDKRDGAIPQTINSTIKTAMLNRYKSTQDWICFKSSISANILDYVPFNDGIYLVVHKQLIDGGYRYFAVREVKDSYTFTGADISCTDLIPLVPSMLDTDGTLAGNSDSKIATQKAGKTYIDTNFLAKITQVRSGFVLSGGGHVTFDSSSQIKWSSAFKVLSNGKGSAFGTSGYFEIAMPTSGAVNVVGGASSRNFSSNGVVLNSGEALWYKLPIGSSYSTNNSNFYITYYSGDDYLLGPEYILLAVRIGGSATDGDDRVLRLGTGEYVYYWHNVGATSEPSFTNGWTNWNSGSDTVAGFCKMGDVVHIRGTVKPGSNNSVIFTLPAGYRPLLYMQFPCVCWNSTTVFGGMHINNNGAITLYYAAISHWFSMAGVYFSVR